MSQELEGLDGIVSLLNDVLIHGKDQAEHDVRLHATLKRLETAQITLNEDKCEFLKKELQFADHIINEEGIKSDPEKTEAVKQMDTPQNVGDIRRFLGMVNQLGKFFPHLANKTKPLRDLLSKKNQFLWGLEQQKSFDELKEELTSTQLLYLPMHHLMGSVQYSCKGKMTEHESQLHMRQDR
jgi:hypothetical protein